MKTKTKNLSLLLVVCIGISLSGCKKMGIKRKLTIAMMSYFKADFVQLKLDDNLVFSDTVSTSGLSSNSASVSLNYAVGKYKLMVIINGKEVSEKFRHKMKGSYIEISYSQSNGSIVITHPDKPSVIEG